MLQKPNTRMLLLPDFELYLVGDKARKTRIATAKVLMLRVGKFNDFSLNIGM